ncbi:ECF transporter S component [Mesorhizobium sp. BR1-1-16]|uniref:ECF transporter S component n=1 Tax=Mesorhizobium sp. BR1-1-16 TaxID=2876653 RepID=UPI001CCCC5FE|nr:ECF transporter S component [Mesorhizobium sp. BR1-1-16]MBZ9935708.1 ECF transporter S component [Mesorhizobium sp. BR1-1-16]
MKFDNRTLVLMAAAIVINIVVGQIVAWLKLPLFIDSIGTVLVGILAGPIAGAIVGTLACLIWGLILDPVAAAFFPVALVIGATAGILARYGWFSSLWKTVVSGAIIAVISTIVSIPIIVYMFGGVTGSGTDFATAYLLAMGTQLIQSVAISNLVQNLADKIITAVIAWLIATRLPRNFTTGLPFFAYTKA